MSGWPDQQKLMEDWWKLFASPNPMPGTNPQGNTNGLPPWAAWFSNPQEQWQTAFSPEMTAAAMQQMTDLTRLTVEKFLAGQQQSFQLLGMTTQAWQAIMNGSTAPAEWSQALSTYLDQLRHQLTSSLEAYQGLTNTDLWQRYTQELSNLSQPWFTAWQKLYQQATSATDPRQAATAGVSELSNLFWETFNQTAGRLIGAPSLGLTREYNALINQGFLLWQEQQKANLDYQLLVGNTWIDAFGAFMQRLIDLALAGKTIDQPEKLMELWVEVADEQFLRVFHADEFAQLQSRYINSSMALRRQQRDLADVWLRSNDLPTRRDLDAAHEAIFALRQEVKAMKKALRTQAAPPPAPAPDPVPSTAPAPKPAKRRPAKAQAKEGDKP